MQTQIRVRLSGAQHCNLVPSRALRLPRGLRIPQRRHGLLGYEQAQKDGLRQFEARTLTLTLPLSLNPAPDPPPQVRGDGCLQPRFKVFRHGCDMPAAARRQQLQDIQVVPSPALPNASSTLAEPSSDS